MDVYMLVLKKEGLNTCDGHTFRIFTFCFIRFFSLCTFYYYYYLYYKGSGLRKMDKWIQEHLNSKHIVALSPEELEKNNDERASAAAYGGIVSIHPWYDHRVVFDWSALHACMTPPDHSKQKGGDTANGKKTSEGPGIWSNAGQTPSQGVASTGEDLSSDIQELDEYGHQQLDEFGEESCMITVIEIDTPWEIQPLDEFASSHTTFSIGEDVSSTSTNTSKTIPKYTSDASSSSLPTFVSSIQLFSFQRGPPGFRPVVQEVHRFLNSLVKQLREQNTRICRFLNSLILFEGNFVNLLHRTAAVHKAVLSTGLKLDLPRSSLSPSHVYRQRSLPVRWDPRKPTASHTSTKSSNNNSSNDTQISWTSIRLESVQSEEDVNLFCTDLFFQWLQDAYDWQCLPPVKPFPMVMVAGGGGSPITRISASSTSPAPAAISGKEREDEQKRKQKEEELSVQHRCRSLFLLFFQRIVKPALHTHLGFPALKDVIDVEGESAWVEELTDKIRSKRQIAGLQKWTALDLRMILCQLGAYYVSPVALFSTR